MNIDTLKELNKTLYDLCTKFSQRFKLHITKVLIKADFTEITYYDMSSFQENTIKFDNKSYMK